MIIYEFNAWGRTNRLYNVLELEVNEKPKSYIGNNFRILKSDIGKLLSGYKMYLLENNPSTFISAIIQQRKTKIKSTEKFLEEMKSELKQWESE
jgi:hypothetical protein